MFITEEPLKMGEYKEYLTDIRNGLGISYRFQFPNGYGAFVHDYDHNEHDPNHIWVVRVIKYWEDGSGWWNWHERCVKVPFCTTGCSNEEVLGLLERIKNL